MRSVPKPCIRAFWVATAMLVSACANNQPAKINNMDSSMNMLFGHIRIYGFDGEVLSPFCSVHFRSGSTDIYEDIDARNFVYDGVPAGDISLEAITCKAHQNIYTLKPNAFSLHSPNAGYRIYFGDLDIHLVPATQTSDVEGTGFNRPALSPTIGLLEITVHDNYHTAMSLYKADKQINDGLAGSQKILLRSPYIDSGTWSAHPTGKKQPSLFNGRI